MVRRHRAHVRPGAIYGVQLRVAQVGSEMTKKEAFDVALPNFVILRFEDGSEIHYAVSDDCMSAIIHELSEHQTISPRGARTT